MPAAWRQAPDGARWQVCGAGPGAFATEVKLPPVRTLAPKLFDARQTTGGEAGLCNMTVLNRS
jgi:hypothetical protein